MRVAANCWEVNKNWEDLAQFCLHATDPDSFLAVAKDNVFPLLALGSCKSCLQKVLGEITPSLPTAAMGALVPHGFSVLGLPWLLGIPWGMRCQDTALAASKSDLFCREVD